MLAADFKMLKAFFLSACSGDTGGGDVQPSGFSSTEKIYEMAKTPNGLFHFNIKGYLSHICHVLTDKYAHCVGIIVS